MWATASATSSTARSTRSAATSRSTPRSSSTDPTQRWFVRGFVQNLTDNNSITGLAVNDQSQGVATNIFTLEPRRYGIAAGFKF